CFPLATSNFGAIAMVPMGAIAGSASSVQGLISVVGGAAIASLIGHQWAGSVFILPAGSACCGVAALIFVLITDSGKLFTHSEPDKAWVAPSESRERAPDL